MFQLVLLVSIILILQSKCVNLVNPLVKPVPMPTIVNLVYQIIHSYNLMVLVKLLAQWDTTVTKPTENVNHVTVTVELVTVQKLTNVILVMSQDIIKITLVNTNAQKVCSKKITVLVTQMMTVDVANIVILLVKLVKMVPITTVTFVPSVSMLNQTPTSIVCNLAQKDIGPMPNLDNVLLVNTHV